METESAGDHFSLRMSVHEKCGSVRMAKQLSSEGEPYRGRCCRACRRSGLFASRKRQVFKQNQHVRIASRCSRKQVDSKRTVGALKGYSWWNRSEMA